MNPTPRRRTADSTPRARSKMPRAANSGCCPELLWSRKHLKHFHSHGSPANPCVFCTWGWQFSLIRFNPLETSKSWLKPSKPVTCLKRNGVLDLTQYHLTHDKPGSGLERIAKSRSGNFRVQKYKQGIDTGIPLAPPQTFTVGIQGF